MNPPSRFGRCAGLSGALLSLLTLTTHAEDAAAAAVKIDTGDNAWMLTSSALVLMMTGPGLALFYGGLVRTKNVLATMMQSFSSCRWSA